jgi:membrane fusion protein, heavy metal efflux system
MFHLENESVQTRDSLFTLADTSTLWVIADVPEDRLTNLTAGTPARIRVAGLPDRSFAGEVILVSPAIDPATRTIAVRIAVKDEQKLLKSGMFAQAELSPLEGSESQTLSVPLEAIQTVEGKQAVFVPVEGEANTFAKRTISVGPSMGAFVPVISGLREGERIVTAGSFILKAELGKAGAAHEH